MSLLDRHDALMLDLDGTVWEGGEALPHAVDAVNSAGIPAVYITNNASRGAEEVAAMLRNVGLAAEAADVRTSAQAALTMAAARLSPGDPVLVVGAQSFKDLVGAEGYRVVESADAAPKVVLHGHSPETGWKQLSEAALAIRAGAAYIASNLDTTLPMQRGLMVLSLIHI